MPAEEGGQPAGWEPGQGDGEREWSHTGTPPREVRMLIQEDKDRLLITREEIHTYENRGLKPVLDSDWKGQCNWKVGR